MQIAINISEEVYRIIKTVNSIDLPSNSTLDEIIYGAIANGTPLPKGHGRLGDLDMLEKEIVNGIKAGLYEEGYEEYGHINDMDDCVECIKLADTIIEADKTENEKA